MGWSGGYLILLPSIETPQEKQRFDKLVARAVQLGLEPQCARDAALVVMLFPDNATPATLPRQGGGDDVHVSDSSPREAPA